MMLTDPHETVRHARSFLHRHKHPPKPPPTDPDEQALLDIIEALIIVIEELLNSPTQPPPTAKPKIVFTVHKIQKKPETW